MSNNKTPVVVFAFNRAEPLQLVLNRLALAEDVLSRDIFVYIDGARNENDAAKIADVLGVVQKAKNSALPNITIRQREKNLGCQKNISSAITDVLNAYGKIIVVEDDVLVSRYFLSYMDTALSLYEKDNRIWGVNGHQCPYLFLPMGFREDVYLSPRNQCTGWGTWKNRWDAVDFGISDWPEFVADRRNMDRLACVGYDLKSLLDIHYRGGLNSWALPCVYFMVKHGLFVIEPRYSLTKNVGFGIDSVHCNKMEAVWSHQRYYNFKPRLSLDIAPNPSVLRCFKYAYNDPRWMARILRKMFRILKTFTPICNDPIDL